MLSVGWKYKGGQLDPYSTYHSSNSKRYNAPPPSEEIVLFGFGYFNSLFHYHPFLFGEMAAMEVN